ncbi:MAG: YciI family protein [Fimbriimonas sp.]
MMTVPPEAVTESSCRLVTDGPYAETREQLAGYLIVDAESLEEAISVAAAHPVSLTGTIEIRPVTTVRARDEGLAPRVE